MTSELEKFYPTMASELVKEIQSIIDKYGDMPIAAEGSGFLTARVVAHIEEFYFDGGYILPLERGPYHCSHWTRSRCRQDVPREFVKIRADYPCDDNDTIDGQAVED